MSVATDLLDALDWRDDRILLDDLVLRLQERPDDPPLEVDSLAFYKSRAIVDAYRRLLAARPGFEPRRIFEIGIWDGGSTAFWYEVFRPEALVAIDLADREDSPLFERFLERRDAGSAVKTFWRVDQTDTPRLQEIASELGGPLDLVIDDGSHLYGPTRASFEALFPALRPGGLYVIEHWPWGHLEEFRRPDHPWAGEIPLTRLVHDLVELQGSSPELVAGVDVGYAFVVVERGPARLYELRAFSLDAHTVRSE